MKTIFSCAKNSNVLSSCDFGYMSCIAEKRLNGAVSAVFRPQVLVQGLQGKLNHGQEAG